MNQLNRKVEGKIFLLAGLIFCAIAIFIRINNLYNYNSWWADDGGAHIAYVETIVNKHRLPTMNETYVAWHEPLYYIAISVWIKLGVMIGYTNLNWWQLFNFFLSIISLTIIWLLSSQLSNENKWLTLTVTSLFGLVFVSVKLSAYVNNELAVQTLILLLIYLFYRWRLLEENKWPSIIYWALLLLTATLIKMTAFIVWFAVILFWLICFVNDKQKYYLKYILLASAVVFFGNLPWFIYKSQNIGTLVSVNLYQEQQRQNILRSDAYAYLWRFDYHTFFDQPYWVDETKSFISIFVADIFSDHYNLFNNVDRMNSLPIVDKILVAGRYTTERVRQSVLRANQVGLLIFMIWVIGFIGWSWRRLVHYNIFNSRYDYFYILLIIGGVSALVYENILFPYLGQGVLKASFIYYVLPLIAILAYSWWWASLRSNVVRFIIIWLPILVYFAFSWPMLVILS